MARESERLIVRPIVSEKSSALTPGVKKVTFEVALSASKIELKDEFKRLFGVTPVAVNTITQHKRGKRTAKSAGESTLYKKAVVTLPAASNVDIFELK